MNSLTLFKNGNPFDISVVQKINPRAKHIGLRLRFEKNEVHLTLPSRWYKSRAEKFLSEKQMWVQKHFSAFQSQNSEKVLLSDGAKISILGEEIILASSEKRGVFVENKTLYVSGEEAYFSGRVKRFIQKELLSYCEKRVPFYTQKINKRFSKITIRNTSSRFGSCSSFGALSFSLSLGVMPLWVVDYVIAHEVSHLVEMNHSAAFWEIVEKIYEGDVSKAKNYLKKNGNILTAM